MTNNKSRQQVTLKEVARYANVSVMTVSNVVRGWPYVSPEMRSKVQEAIKTLGYRPSAVARSLVTGRSCTVGVVLPDVSNPFFGQVIRGCEDVLSADSYGLFLYNTDENPAKERAAIDNLISRGVDALILCGTRMTGDELTRLTGNGMPIIAVDSTLPQPQTNSTYIMAENQMGAAMATRHLIDLGRRRTGHLCGPSNRRITAQLRLGGYRDALEQAGIDYDPALVVEAKPSIRGGYLAAKRLLKEQAPAGLFCYNDLMAIGAMVAAQELGMDVPRDIAVVGFDDIFAAALVMPPLTTVRLRQYELGRMTGELLLERLRDPELPAKLVSFPVELIVRESCGAAGFSAGDKRAMMESLVTSLAVDLPNDDEPAGLDS
jgi:LacI family transcriptional regulator